MWTPQSCTVNGEKARARTVNMSRLSGKQSLACIFFPLNHNRSVWRIFCIWLVLFILIKYLLCQETSISHQSRSRARWREGAHHSGWILCPHMCPSSWWRLWPLLWLLLWRRWRGGRGWWLLLWRRWLWQRGVLTCFFHGVPTLAELRNSLSLHWYWSRDSFALWFARNCRLTTEKVWSVPLPNQWKELLSSFRIYFLEAKILLQQYGKGLTM